MMRRICAPSVRLGRCVVFVHGLHLVCEVTGIPEMYVSLETLNRNGADTHSQILTLS